MVNCPAEAALIHGDRRTDGRADMKKVIGAIRDYANAPERKQENEKQETEIKLKNGGRRYEKREKG
jgi:hypothetical protein